MRDNKSRKRQKIVAVIAIILIAMMVLTLLAAAVRADTVNGSSVSGSVPSSTNQDGEQGDNGTTLTPVSISGRTSNSGKASNSGKTSDPGTATNSGTVSNTGNNSDPGTATNSGTSSDSADAVTPGTKRAGVYIENINVTGMSKSQIEAAVQEKMKELGDDNIVLYAGDNQVSVKADTLGLTYTNTLIAEEAYSIGRKGDILKRFLADRRLASGEPIVLQLQLEVSESAVRKAISSKTKVLNSEPRANGLKLQSDHTFLLTPGRDGVKVREDPSVRKVMQYMETEWHGGEGGVSLDAEITPYPNKSADLTKIKDLLGSGTTSYQSGNINHDTNVEIAARNIDGTVVYPGEEFSAEDAIGPTTKENGFLPGDTYEGSKVTETYGGGVCQVSSTLYNAVLQAELKVTERHNHSFLVSYVDPGFDAAISEGTMDFRFTNNTDAPIYIQAVLQNGNLTFNIYGHETRDKNREVVYQAQTRDEVDVETVYTADSSAPLGSITMSGGIGGITADVYKDVYVNGELDSEDLMTTSIYQMMPLTYTVGTEGADAATVDAISQAIASGDLSTIQSAVGNGTIEETDVMEN